MGSIFPVRRRTLQLRQYHHFYSSNEHAFTTFHSTRTVQRRFTRPMLVFIRGSLSIMIMLHRRFTNSRPTNSHVLRNVVIIVSHRTRMIRRNQRTIIIRVRRTLHRLTKARGLVLRLQRFMNFGHLLRATRVRLNGINRRQVNSSRKASI